MPTTFRTEPSLLPNDEMDNELIQRIHDLPILVFEIIQDFVFTITPRTTHIDKNYKPPSILQVDRTSREKLTRQYYSQTKFTASLKSQEIVEWATSLLLEHSKAITHIELRALQPGTDRLCRLAVRPRLLYLVGRLHGRVERHQRKWWNRRCVWWVRYSDGLTDSLCACMQIPIQWAPMRW